MTYGLILLHTQRLASSIALAQEISIVQYQIRLKLDWLDQTVGLGPDWTGLLNQQSSPKIKDRTVTGQMRSDRSGSVRRLAGCNYGGNGGRVLIMAAMAATQLN
jgi:hypothetical protein